MSSISVRFVEPTSIAVVRRVVSRSELSRAVRDGCGAAWTVLREQAVRGGRNLAVYRDDAISLESGCEVHGAFIEGGGVVRSETPAGNVVTTTHYGSYAGLATAHEAIRAWCRENHRTIAGPSWEVYGH